MVFAKKSGVFFHLQESNTVEIFTLTMKHTMEVVMKTPLLETFWLRTLFPATVALSLAMSAVCPIGCRSTDGYGIEILQGDFSCPQIESVTVISSSSVQMEFSKDVTVLQAEVYPSDTSDGESESLGSVSWQVSEDCVVFTFENATKVGVEYVLEGSVEDLSGNTLTFAVSFSGPNDNPAQLFINEFRKDFRTANEIGEFVELYVLKSGNLSGLEVYSAHDGDSLKYAFPAIDVSEGDYITVHMRQCEEWTGMVSEEGDDLTLSTQADSCNTARDLWSENTKSVFANTDIIMVRFSETSEIMDAVLYAYNKDGETTTWDSSYDEILASISESGLWQGSTDTADVIQSKGVGYSKSFARQNLSKAISAYQNGEEIPNSADVWIVTKSPTPGYKNSTVAAN